MRTKKLIFPSANEMQKLRQYVKFERDKNLPQIKKSASVWLKAHWENKLSYEVNWLGMPIIQSADDMIILQEIVFDVKPDVIVETGIAHGGSLVYFASILELLGKGRVIGIDIEVRSHNRRLLEKHPMAKRIQIIEGNSRDTSIFKKVKKATSGKKVLVVLDSNHRKDHVLVELRMYSQLVNKGGYIIVEDTIMPKVAAYKHAKDYYKTDNAARAAQLFLKENNHFVSDKKWEKLGFTYFPNGFLKRIS